MKFGGGETTGRLSLLNERGGDDMILCSIMVIKH